MSFPSPDSSTHLIEERKRKNEDSKRNSSKKKKVKSVSIDAIQDDDVNSTQGICDSTMDGSGVKTKSEDDIFRKLDQKQRHLKKKIKASLKLLKEYKNKTISTEKVLKFQKDFKLLGAQAAILGIKPLSEYGDKKKLLCKELFKVINKKQFKKMLPKNLKRYDVKEVKNWCCDEIQRVSKKNLLAAMNGEETTLSSSSSSESEETDDEKADDSSANENNLDATSTTEKSLDVSDTQDIMNEISRIRHETYSRFTENSEAGLSSDVIQIQNESEVFEEIIKMPDQTEVDELMNCAVEQPVEDLSNLNDGLSGNDDNKEVTEEIRIGVEKKLEKKNLEIKELELRARALKSFIEARERRKCNEGGV